MKKIILIIITLLLLKIDLFAQLKVDLSTSEQIINSTLYLEFSKSYYENNNKVTEKGFCTGIFFKFKFDSLYAYTLLTNKHCIEGFESVSFYLTELKNKKPDYGKMQRIIIDYKEEDWIKHPDLDLAILSIDKIIEANQTQKYLIITYDESIIPNDSIISSFSAIEDVLVIGYHKKYWDGFNNIPIVRKGITASPIKLNYRGIEEFLVDVPTFQGNSGSPVLIYDAAHSDPLGNFYVAERIFFLGISYSVFYYLEPEIVKNENQDTVLVKNLLNLNRVIKSSKILDFKKLILEREKQNAIKKD